MNNLIENLIPIQQPQPHEAMNAENVPLPPEGADEQQVPAPPQQNAATPQPQQQPPPDPQLQLLLTIEQQVTRDAQERWREEEKLRARIPECDGSDAESLKKWLQELTTVPGRLRPRALKDTARGTLLLAIQSMEEEHPEVGWDELQNYIISTFITTDYASVMKSELKGLKRKPFESIAMFSQRFRTLADIAYPSAQRGPLHQERLCQIYTRSLSDKAAWNRMVRGGFPNTLEEAVNRAQAVDRDAAAYRKLTGEEKSVRREEAMEIDAVTIAAAVTEQLKKSAPQPQPPLELQKAQTEIAKLKAQLREIKEQARQPPGNPSQRGEWRSNQQGQLECYRCGRKGHLARACRAPQSMTDRQKRPTYRTGTAPSQSRYSKN